VKRKAVAQRPYYQCSLTIGVYLSLGLQFNQSLIGSVETLCAPAPVCLQLAKADVSLLVKSPSE
jgi:hypothetical protein